MIRTAFSTGRVERDSAGKIKWFYSRACVDETVLKALDSKSLEVGGEGYSEALGSTKAVLQRFKALWLKCDADPDAFRESSKQILVSGILMVQVV